MSDSRGWCISQRLVMEAGRETYQLHIGSRLTNQQRDRGEESLTDDEVPGNTCNTLIS
jgi:hypothetical protein